MRERYLGASVIHGPGSRGLRGEPWGRDGLSLGRPSAEAVFAAAPRQPRVSIARNTSPGVISRSGLEVLRIRETELLWSTPSGSRVARSAYRALTGFSRRRCVATRTRVRRMRSPATTGRRRADSHMRMRGLVRSATVHWARVFVRSDIFSVPATASAWLPAGAVCFNARGAGPKPRATSASSARLPSAWIAGDDSR
jgi:hypothetical protein